jgi:hypothetical protein
MALITNDEMMKLLKPVFLSGVANAKNVGSKLEALMKVESGEGGKDFRYASQYSNGGNFGVSYNSITNNPDVGVRNEEWVGKYGHLTGFFDVTQPETDISVPSNRAAYMNLIANKMSGCFDGLAKTLATYMYVGKDGVLGTVESTSGSTITVKRSTAIKMDLGTRFRVVSTLADYDTAAVLTVVGKSKGVITFSGTPSGTITAGDLVVLNGRGTRLQGPDGLEDFIPTVRDNTTAMFREVNRAKAWDNLAGQVVATSANATGEEMAQALVELLKEITMFGDKVSLIINNNDYDKITKALGLDKYYWIGANMGNEKNHVTKGVSSLAVAFGDAFTGKAIIDPYCPEGVAYMINLDDFTFIGLNNIEKVIRPVTSKEDGDKYDIESIGDAGIGNNPHVQLNMDKLFTIAQGQDDEVGPTFRIAAHLYGNFVIRDTSAIGKVVFN